MTHVYLVVAGPTEQAFVTGTLAPHLLRFGTYAYPILIGSVGHKGGRVSFDRAARDIGLLFKQHGHRHGIQISTMFDLYGLGKGFPNPGSPIPTDPWQKVVAFERAIDEAIGDPRFFAYLQLHEFEALLLCAPEKLGTIYDDQPAADALARSMDGLAPEAVNDERETSPSHRIIDHFPRYARDKTTTGPLCAEDIGLEQLRGACPHFGAWLTRLEQIGQT